MTDDKAYRIDRFERLIATMDGGGFAQELADVQHQMVEKIETHHQEYGGKPKAVLTVKMELSRNERGQIVATATYKAEMPKIPAAQEVFFATPDNRLTAKNPNAETLFHGDDLGRKGWKT